MKLSRMKKIIVLLGTVGLIGVIFMVTEMGDMSIFKHKTKVQYEVSEEVFNNPLMGFAPDANQISEVEKNSLVYVDITFRELEAEEGVFDFSRIEQENHLKRWKESGKHVVFRFINDYPGNEEHMDIPDWLYEKTGGDGFFYDNAYGKGYAPDYNNPIFIAHHARAIEELGAYFGKDSFFSFVQLGSLGHWGEWHSYFETGVDKIPTEEIRNQYIAPYIKAFPNAKIMMRQPFEAADSYGFGLYNDMTGHLEETTIWLDTIKKGGDYDQTSEEDGLVPMNDAWKTVPIGGEFTSSIPMEQMIVRDLYQTTELLKASHTTFLGQRIPNHYDSVSQVFQEGTQKVLQTLGYHISIKEMAFTSSRFLNTMNIKLMWENSGIAPFYWDWPAYLYVKNSSGDLVSQKKIDLSLTNLLPGKIIKTKTEVNLPEDDDYFLYVGIEDPERDEPAIYLEMETERDGALSLLHTFSEN